MVSYTGIKDLSDGERMECQRVCQEYQESLGKYVDRPLRVIFKQVQKGGRARSSVHVHAGSVEGHAEGWDIVVALHAAMKNIEYQLRAA